MRAGIIVVAGSLVASLGCGGSRQPSDATPSTEAPAACTAVVAGADVSGWRQVTASGFTFCLPTDWRGGGGRIWRRDNANLEWSIGSGTARARVPFSVGRSGSAPPPSTEYREFNETIGGRPARLWRSRGTSAYTVGAHWSGPGVSFTGEAPSLGDADLLLVIYRTVRFAS